MRHAFVLLALPLVALAAMRAVAEEHLPADPKYCDPASYPYDAVTAAPYSHRVVFEDAHVRILDIRLPAGASEPIHIHALPSVIMGDTGGNGGAKFIYAEYRMVDGRFEEISRNEVTPSAGYRAVWSTPEGPHAISNVGPVSVRFTRIEIKPESCAR